MKNLYAGLLGFIKSLSLLDIVFIAAMIFLIVLIVIMIYIMRIDEEDWENSEFSDNKREMASLDNNIVLEDKKDNELDLNLLSKELEGITPPNINLTPYEEEQEERAIISYDELISNTGKVKLNYEEEQDNDGVMVKKVDLENLNTPDMEMPKLASTSFKDNLQTNEAFNYAKEEEFLVALKKMRQTLY